MRVLPILSDVKTQSGKVKRHYFHQDLWAARRIYEEKPAKHIDVGSRVDGFVAHLLTFMDVTVIDIRSFKSKIKGLTFHQADMMEHDPGHNRILVESVSCLHALEHFGLGRYGDPVCLNGWEKGLRNLAALVAPGGRLYLSVPIGPQVIEFNAQRIFKPETIITAAAKLDLQLIEFSYIDDAGDLHESVGINEAKGCTYGCGCFLFSR